MEKESKLVQGNEACAEAAIAAGVRFFGGYPITPATEIAEVMAKRLPEVGGVFIQMEDEIGSISAVIGAAAGGGGGVAKKERKKKQHQKEKIHTPPRPPPPPRPRGEKQWRRARRDRHSG